MSIKLVTEHHLEFLSLQMKLHRLVWVYTCQSTALLEISHRGSYKVSNYRPTSETSSNDWWSDNCPRLYAGWVHTSIAIRESPPQFENRIMARVYVRSIARSTMYNVPKRSILFAGTGVWKTCSVACGISSTKIDYSDYPKKNFNQQNKLSLWFFNKISL